MEMLKPQPKECVFNNLDILVDLVKNKVPENLKDKLDYSCDELQGITREVYVDKETGDEFANGVLPGGLKYGIITTKVGEYKYLTFAGGFECFFNGIATDRNTFFSILKQQAKLPDSK